MIPVKPKDVIWSDEQWQAIYETGHNILVSAGAGSGKTAVLTERLKQKVLSGIHLNELIVLTFTKDAASVMKERLRQTLIDEVKTNNSVHLMEELNQIDEAHIQTFDSFTAYLVKKYHYLLNLPSKIDIIDANLLQIKIEQWLEEILEELFEEENAHILLLANAFTIKNSENIKKMLFQIVQSFELIIDEKKYIEHYFDYYFTPIFNQFIQENYENYLIKKIKSIENIWNHLPKFATELAKEHYSNCISEVKGLINLANTKENFSYLTLKKHLEINFPRIPSKIDEVEKVTLKEAKDQTKVILKKLIDDTKYDSIQEALEEQAESKKYIEAILYIVKQVIPKIENYKKELHAYSYMDISKMAIQLLDENKEICEEIKYSTNEILIDEYQDTSNVQEILISKIANHNLYMVGDIKQSIYRFRNANPTIFKEKYHQYKDKKDGVVIDLMKNFRSREEVLDDINLIFEDLMEVEFGGVNYNDGHRLIYGNKAYQEFANGFNHMNVITYDNSAYEDFNNEEIEAFIIGQDILQKMNNFKVFNMKTKTARRANYSDFAILTASTSAYNTYAKVFKYLGIPFIKSNNSSFIHSEEIYFVKAVLECSYAYLDSFFYETNFKKSLLSVLRSFCLEINDDQIHELYTNNPLDLKKYFPEIDDLFKKYSLLMKNTALSEIILMIYHDFSVYEHLIKLGSIAEREQKLQFLYTKSIEFQKLSIYEFLEYLSIIESSSEKDIEFNMGAESNVDAVSFTSIHKSKGLEYAICYVSDLKRKFNVRDIRSRFLFSEIYGLISPIVKEGLKEVITKRLLEVSYLQEDIGEKIRLFYVALTRAKEKLIFVTPNFTNDSEEIYSSVKDMYRSFYDFLNSIYFKLHPYHIEVDLANYNLTKKYLFTKDKELPKFSNITKMYQNVNTKQTKNTYIKPSKQINQILTKEEYQLIELGENFHKILEFTNILTKEINSLDSIINKNYQKMVNRFLNNPFINNHQFIHEYHEYAYYDENNHMGIIDLILETDTEIFIIDYKLKNIDDKEYIKQLQRYKDYIKICTNKKVVTYFYSILKDEFVQVVV